MTAEGEAGTFRIQTSMFALEISAFYQQSLKYIYLRATFGETRWFEDI